ncbi:hypothetical protein SS37A_34050 [Methylocystis iwaonis]|uniref:Uncharacterized protein n=1 Tax=Methylocystis iwaonis TaxID=2885079 RepID=A0ABM8EDA0_9HYPH|nr:hypothetical protein SS37A_34050 [Methylocystis iwaonis]
MTSPSPMVTKTYCDDNQELGLKKDGTFKLESYMEVTHAGSWARDGLDREPNGSFDVSFCVIGSLG